MDEPITKKEVGSWVKVAATVLPLLVAILTTTWALASQASESTQKITQIIEVQKEHAALLKVHDEILRRVPTLEQTLLSFDKAITENTRLSRSLNDTMIRLQTRMEHMP